MGYFIAAVISLPSDRRVITTTVAFIHGGDNVSAAGENVSMPLFEHQKTCRACVHLIGRLYFLVVAPIHAQNREENHPKCTICRLDG